MGKATNEQTVWSLQGNLAELKCGYLSGRIDTTRPHVGLRDTELRGSQRPSVFLGVHRAAESLTADAAAVGDDAIGWPLPLAEVYVRGNDLVATYQPTSDWPFSPQLYWRANALQAIEGVLASMSLLVSVQTHLLDTCPQIGVATQPPRGELFLVSVGGSTRPRVEPVNHYRRISPAGEVYCIVSRLEDWPLSYVEIMPPGDFHEITLRPEAKGISFEWHLFADFLEKGVIRRARVHAALLPRENDIELAAACCVAIERLELPLTT